MADEQMIELRLDVMRACHRRAGIAVERLHGLGITITTLVQEHQRDPDALAKLYSLALTVHDTPKWTLEEYLRRFDRWEAVFIATSGSEYVGYTYLIERNDTPGILHQCMTGVRPEHRRRGIGTALKAHGIEYARARGFWSIVTRVRPGHQASLAMNRKLGFQEQPIPMGP